MTVSLHRYVPLYQAAFADLALRPENEFAFSSSHISASKHILFLDDLPSSADSLANQGLKYALVDHNRLSYRFGHQDDSVVALIDHHEDEGYHKTARPRKIQVPVGSCSSLVAEYFHAVAFQANTPGAVPVSLADLLIQAILIDTDNVKNAPKGKAVETDNRAMQFLLSSSTFANPTGSLNVTTEDSEAIGSIRNGRQSIDKLKMRTAQLAGKKNDLSALGSRDLLRRDYKEYESESMHCRYGLSSVPMALRSWLDRTEIKDEWETLLAILDQWGSERDLDIIGVLTSYNGKEEPEGGKKRRELLFLLRENGANLPSLRGIFTSLEADQSLRVGALESGGPVFKTEAAARWDGRVWAYQQKNAEATRKQVAPAVKTAIQGIENSDKT